MKRLFQIAAATAVLFALAGAAGAQDGCNIKGNVSTKGERIYHMPGQEYYDETLIQASHVERWFCSEEGPARQASVSPKFDTQLGHR